MHTVIHMDCVAGMALLPDNTVDSIVTDPPYELGFMGKSWDASGIAYSVAMWREAMRVLKPGGHLLAFSGSRTYHRMTCAIEDAGFEIRDQIMWVYSSGFPKSHNMDNHRGTLVCGCAVPYTHDRTEPKTQRDLHSVQHADVPSTVDSGEGRGQVLQPGVPQQSAPLAGRQQLSGAEVRTEESSLEGWGDAAQASRQLPAGSVRQVPVGIGGDGADGRLRDGASACDGAMVRPTADTNGVRPPHQPQAARERAAQPRTVAGQSKPQAGGAWSVCGGCGKPVVPKGLGTALKPAHEPICVARKPLIGTVAANVLAHGTGALNVDGCRVPGIVTSNPQRRGAGNISTSGHGGQDETGLERVSDAGRWPANFLHDGLPEEWAKFFYCAKASKADRNEGLDGFEPRSDSAHRKTNLETADNPYLRGVTVRANTHPTVKPTDLMRYLCRLVTPPGGTVMDPFTGSGSTGKAAKMEGFNFIGFEMQAEYVAIAEARIAAAVAP